MKIRRGLILLSLTVMTVHSVAAGDRTPFFSVLEKTDDDRSATIRALLGSLEQKCPKVPQSCRAAKEVHRILTGGAGELLPLWVIYLDENLEPRANRLIWKGRVTPFVRDAQNVWVVVVAERDVALEASLVSLWRQKEGILDGLQDVFISSGKRTLENEASSTVSKPLELVNASDGTTAPDGPWIGWQRFHVQTGATYALELAPAGDQAQQAAGFRRVQARFTNSKNQVLDFGVALAASYIDDSSNASGSASDLDGVRTGNFLIGGYWTLHLYLKRPMLIKPIAQKFGSRYTTSYAITVGANLNIFDTQEFLVGLNVGHLLGRHGIVVGANFVNPFEDSDDEDDVLPFAGVNFNF